ncbi:MAG: 1-deoxy-D-xylulose-5-phosphate synthase [Rickettsiales bacterium]|jgi:1-deoxy-D-xylulose-5-phosphate synthase
MSLIDQVNFPSDLKKLSLPQLKQLAEELRIATIDAVSKTGGHLGAGLGVIELTIALHHVFDTPKDKIIWDVGHQSYPHKILTGRKDRMETIRQPEGLSGFAKRAESEYDAFGAGHSSTSVSAALGFAVARDLKDQKSDVIAVIGDGAISAGMAYEALNNAGVMHNRLIVILNDNDMSIAPPVGAMSNYLSKLASSKSYLKFRGLSKKILRKLPDNISKYPRKFEKAIKEWWMGGNIFEDMGFYYIGAVDGHNLDILVPILQNIRDDKSTTPILIHAVTEKGHGYNKIMKSTDCLHAVAKFDPKTGIQDKKPAGSPTYSQIFGQSLTAIAKKDQNIVAVTAAMPSGTGLDIFAKEFPQKQGEKSARLFDVGIAEQHAVTFAAGLSCEGIKPFVAIYSTFLQRAYDQIVHDVAVQKLPVRFAIDRAGFVGADGPTHAGSFDISYLINLPNFVLMAPSNGNELARMVKTAANINDRPSAIRYPRGNSQIDIDFENIQPLEIGKGEIIKQGSDVAILCFGTIKDNAVKAGEIILESHNIDITIADARFAKPLDHELIFDLAKNHRFLITLEEGVVGGFGSAVMQLLSEHNYLEKDNFKFRQMFMKDDFIEQNNINVMQDQAGIGIQNIIEMILENK